MAAYTFYRSGIAFLILMPLGAAYPFWHKKALCRKRKERLKGEFKEAILILSSLMSAGYSMENAISVSVGELSALYGEKGMLVTEFSDMAKQIRLNITAEQAWAGFAERSGLEEVYSFVQVFMTAKRGGGDLVSIMNRTAESIRDKIQVHEEIKTMTAARKFEQQIMDLLPFLIIFYIDVTSPGFFELMYTTAMGRILMTGCLVVYVAALWLSEKILDIEVS